MAGCQLPALSLSGFPELLCLLWQFICMKQLMQGAALRGAEVFRIDGVIWLTTYSSCRWFMAGHSRSLPDALSSRGSGS